MEIRGGLCIGVRDVHEGVPQRRAEALAPVVIEKRNHTQNWQGHSDNGLDRVAEIVFHADVDGCVVHVVLNGPAVDDLESANVIFGEVEVRTNVDAPAVGDPAKVEWVGCGIDPGDLSPDTAHLNVTPFSSEASVEADVGPLELRNYASEFDAAGINAFICAGAGALKGDHDIAVTLNRNPANLHVTEEDHSVRPPIFDRVREDVGVHERAPGLAGADVPQLAVRVPKPEGGLSSINSYSIQLEFKNRLEIAEWRLVK